MVGAQLQPTALKAKFERLTSAYQSEHAQFQEQLAPLEVAEAEAESALSDAPPVDAQ